MEIAKKPENIILFDWLSFTTKLHDVAYIKNLLGLSSVKFETLTGVRGYAKREYFNSISIHYGNNDHIWIEMSGQGCRAFETFGNGDYEKIFDYIITNFEYCNLTRLDIAYDEFTGLLNLNKLCNDVRNQEYISKSNYWSVIESSKGQCIEIGSPQSLVRIRIYDKARERGFVNQHWIRTELQLRDERAYGFINLFDVSTFGTLFCSVLKNYLRFIIPDKNQSNISRLKTKKYWEKFLGQVEPISIYFKPGFEYNIENLEHYVFNQAGGAIYTAIEIMGEDEFLKVLECRKPESLNPKYERLLFNL